MLFDEPTSALVELPTGIQPPEQNECPLPCRSPAAGSFLSLAGALAATAGTNPGYAAEPRRGGTLSLLSAAAPPTISAVAHTAYNTVIVAAKV